MKVGSLRSVCFRLLTSVHCLPRRGTSLKMLFSRLVQAALLSAGAVQNAAALAIGNKPNMMFRPELNKRALQDIVTYDEVCGTHCEKMLNESIV